MGTSWTRWVVVAILGALALGACGDGQGTQPPASGDPQPTVTVTVTETVVPSDQPPVAPTASETGDTEPLPDADPCDAEGLDAFAFVFVTMPSPGAEVASPFSVAGCSNTFEATVNWQLVDRDGGLINEGFATASCGTGCAGQFDFTVEYEVPARHIGYLRVFESSAEDGSPQLVNSIPVILNP